MLNFLKGLFIAILVIAIGLAAKTLRNYSISKTVYNMEYCIENKNGVVGQVYLTRNRDGNGNLIFESKTFTGDTNGVHVFVDVKRPYTAVLVPIELNEGTTISIIFEGEVVAKRTYKSKIAPNIDHDVIGISYELGIGQKVF